VKSKPRQENKGNNLKERFLIFLWERKDDRKKETFDQIKISPVSTTMNIIEKGKKDLSF
jgi:hypothetical protein